MSEEFITTRGSDHLVVPFQDVSLAVPKWTGWVAMDANGAVYAYQFEPVTGTVEWVSPNKSKRICVMSPNTDWQETKTWVFNP